MWKGKCCLKFQPETHLGFTFAPFHIRLLCAKHCVVPLMALDNNRNCWRALWSHGKKKIVQFDRLPWMWPLGGVGWGTKLLAGLVNYSKNQIVLLDNTIYVYVIFKCSLPKCILLFWILLLALVTGCDFNNSSDKKEKQTPVAEGLNLDFAENICGQYCFALPNVLYNSGVGKKLLWNAKK